MSTTLKRTSMALDEATRDTLDELSQEWGISKAEVLRRSVALLEKEEVMKAEDEKLAIKKRLAAVDWLQKNGVSHEVAENYKKELQAEREAWRDPWEEYEASRH